MNPVIRLRCNWRDLALAGRIFAGLRPRAVLQVTCPFESPGVPMASGPPSGSLIFTGNSPHVHDRSMPAWGLEIYVGQDLHCGPWCAASKN